MTVVIEYQPLPLPHGMPSQWPEEPTITEMAVPADLQNLLLSRQQRAHLIVLPRALPPPLMADEWLASKAMYDKGDIVAVEHLSRQGVNIAALHDPDERNELAQFAAEVVVAVGVFVAQALAEHEITALYEYFKGVIGRVRSMLQERGQPSSAVVLTADLFKVRTVDGAEVVAERISGPAEPTIDLLLRAIREANRSAAQRPESTK